MMEQFRKIWFFGAVFLVLVARYIICFVTDEYHVPEEWQSISGKEVRIEGIVTAKEDRASVRILYLSGHLLVYDLNFTDVTIGSYVQVSGETESFSEKRNPGGFDEQEYYRRKKYWAKMFADQILVLEPADTCLKEVLFELRQRWTNLLKDEIGEENGGILAAMLLGNKGSVNLEEKEWYQKAGFGHLLAISGFHVGFFGTVLYSIFRRIRMPLVLSMAITGVLLLGYVLLCQASVSAIRAYLMYMIHLGAGVCGRVYQGKRTLVLAGTAILLYRPMDILDAGFLLSFGAMTGILVIYPIFLDMLSTQSKIVQSFLLSVSVQIVILPIVLYFYYEIPVYVFIIGTLVTSLFGILMGLGSLGCLLSLSESFLAVGFSHIVFVPAGWILQLYHVICKMELKLPFARWVAGQPKMWQLVLYYLILVVVIRIWRKREKKLYILGWMLSLCIFCSFPDLGELSFVMLDVGQGDCFYIEGPRGRTYMVDGGSSDRDQPGKYILEPFLKSQGVSRLDYVFLTHGDLDHVNGILEMIQRKEIDIRNLVVPVKSVWDDTLTEAVELAENSGICVLVMEQGDYLEEGNLKIQALYPEDGEESGNNASLVLDICYQRFSVLMTGDLEQEGEETLRSKNRLRKYTILKIGHHGSKTSSSEKFISDVQPRFAFVSAGINNVYGHPHAEVLERLQNYGAKIFRTDRMGAVLIHTDGYQMSEPEQTLKR